MNCKSQAVTYSKRILLSGIAPVFVVAMISGAFAADHRGALTEEFHQTYSLTPQGRVELDNINGPVHISTWDRNEVKVDAIKSADMKERLDEAKIEVDVGQRLHFHSRRNIRNMTTPSTGDRMTIRRAWNIR